jgi:hypothetical protein
MSIDGPLRTNVIGKWIAKRSARTALVFWVSGEQSRFLVLPTSRYRVVYAVDAAQPTFRGIQATKKQDIPSAMFVA